MMKRILPIFIFLSITSFGAFSQLYKFPQPGFKQGESIYWFDYTPFNSGHLPNTISYLKDTTVFGYTYSKINAGKYGIIFTRYNMGQVFVANPPLGYPSQEVLLYDFSLNVNDTFNLYLSPTANQYGTYQELRGTYQVDSVSTVTCLNGQKRKYMRLHPYLGSTSTHLYWIDAIGDIKNGLLYQATDGIDDGADEIFVCNHDSTGMVFGGTDSLFDCSSLKMDSSQIGFQVNNSICDVPFDSCITAIGLSGCSNYSYQWSNGATTAQICSLSPATYTVTVTDCSGNSATSSVTLSSFVNHLGINISTTASTQNNYSGQGNGTVSIYVTGGTPAYSYAWSPYPWSATGGWENPPQIIFLPCGTYSITVTDANGCTGTDTAVVDGCITTNIPEFHSEINFRIFPNPASTFVTLETSQTGEFRIQLIDMLGQTVNQTQQPTSSSFTIDVGTLPKGIYIAQLLDIQKNISGRQRIIVQ